MNPTDRIVLWGLGAVGLGLLAWGLVAGLATTWWGWFDTPTLFVGAAVSAAGAVVAAESVFRALTGKRSTGPVRKAWDSSVGRVQPGHAVVAAMVWCIALGLASVRGEDVLLRFWEGKGGPESTRALSGLMLLAAGQLHLLWHEAAHALAARRVGLPLVSLHAGAIEVEYGQRPVTRWNKKWLHVVVGMVRYLDTGARRNQRALVIAAGPMATLVLTGLAWLALGQLVLGPLLERAASTLVSVGFFIFLANIIPFRAGALGGGTDGYQLAMLYNDKAKKRF